MSVSSSIILDEIDPNYPMETILGEPRQTAVDGCAVCNNPTAFLCTFCHGIFYCTDDHSAQDEVHHALICRAGATIPKRPNSQGRNVIAILVFPEHSPQPYYAWTSYEVNVHGRPVFDQSMWFGDGYRSIPRFITQHPVTRQQLGHAIMYFQRDENVVTKDTGSMGINLAVHNFTGGKNTGLFRGPLLFLAVARTMDLSREWLVSFLPADLPMLLHDLSKSMKQGVAVEQVGSITGVVCYPVDPARHFNKDVKATNTLDETEVKMAIEQLDIPTTHPIFDVDNKDVHEPTFAETYYFPIRAYKFPGYRGRLGNTLAASLFPTTAIIKDAEDTDCFGRPVVTSPAIAADSLGAILIARRDGKPLSVAHVCKFIEFGKYLADLWHRYGEYKARKTQTPGTMDRITAADCAIMDEMYESLEGDAFALFWNRDAAEDDGPFADMEKRGRGFYIDVDDDGSSVSMPMTEDM
ncbi:hypothetical protein ABW21_db0201460 [Orbilia brochopaga]|nr:hypothetical protein ABW21_db0201460 [Drechslerella brochopaga]